MIQADAIMHQPTHNNRTSRFSATPPKLSFGGVCLRPRKFFPTQKENLPTDFLKRKVDTLYTFDVHYIN